MKVIKVLLVIFCLFLAYVASLFLRYYIHRDNNGTVHKLKQELLSSGYTRIPDSNNRIITFAKGQIRSEQDRSVWGGSRIFFTPKNGSEKLLNLPLNLGAFLTE